MTYGHDINFFSHSFRQGHICEDLPIENPNSNLEVVSTTFSRCLPSTSSFCSLSMFRFSLFNSCATRISPEVSCHEGITQTAPVVYQGAFRRVDSDASIASNHSIMMAVQDFVERSSARSYSFGSSSRSSQRYIGTVSRRDGYTGAKYVDILVDDIKKQPHSVLIQLGKELGIFGELPFVKLFEKDQEGNTVRHQVIDGGGVRRDVVSDAFSYLFSSSSSLKPISLWKKNRESGYLISLKTGEIIGSDLLVAIGKLFYGCYKTTDFKGAYNLTDKFDTSLFSFLEVLINQYRSRVSDFMVNQKLPSFLVLRGYAILSENRYLDRILLKRLLEEELSSDDWDYISLFLEPDSFNCDRTLISNHLFFDKLQGALLERELEKIPYIQIVSSSLVIASGMLQQAHSMEDVDCHVSALDLIKKVAGTSKKTDIIAFFNLIWSSDDRYKRRVKERSLLMDWIEKDNEKEASLEWTKRQQLLKAITGSYFLIEDSEMQFSFDHEGEYFGFKTCFNELQFPKINKNLSQEEFDFMLEVSLLNALNETGFQKD